MKLGRIRIEAYRDFPCFWGFWTRHLANGWEVELGNLHLFFGWNPLC